MPNLVETMQVGRVRRVWLNRPDKRNALTVELCLALADALDDGNSNPQVGVILLAARGKVFCAGMDLAEVSHTAADPIDRAHERLFTIGSRLDKPLVIAVEGAALGGGAGVVANGHIVVAAEDAVFGLTEIRLGLWPFLVYRALTASMGDRRTLELALTGRIFSAREAREFGLVHDVSVDCDVRAMEIAKGLAASSPTAIDRGMSFVRATRGKGWESIGEIARRFRGEVLASADFAEGLAAFREKRDPRWPSRK